jgi:5'-nucleotidase
MAKKLRILLSNDDSVHAPGIHALAAEFRRHHEVWIVAPERERSTTGHALTLHKPLRLYRHDTHVYSVSGGPADCIHIGISQVLKGRAPDLVLSGINRGANLGQDVFYSGTASAAREATNLGLPAVAVSLSLDHHKPGQKEHYATAARALRKILDQVLPHFAGKNRSDWSAGLAKWPEGMMLNVNVPNLEFAKLKGLAVATQGYRNYGGKIVKRQDMRGRDYYWIGGTYQGYRNIAGSDCWYVDRGYASVTPLELDTTMKDVYGDLKDCWKGKA